MKRPRAIAAAVLVLAALGAVRLGADGPFLYQPITPCRLLDTHLADGPFGGPALGSDELRTFAVSAGCPQVPLGAAAVYVTATVSNASAPGELRLYSANSSAPLTSNLIFDTTTNPASNGALVNLSAEGAFDAKASLSAPGTAHLTVDVTGWFGPATVPGQSSFVPVPPCRLVDTRGADGLYGGPAFADGQWRSFPATGQCGVPPDATALVLNATVWAPTGAGSLTLAPDSPAITLNFSSGQERSGPAIARLDDASGAVNASVAVSGSGTAHLTLDVTGYYKE